MRYRPPKPSEVTLVRHGDALEARGVGDAPGQGVRARWWPCDGSTSGSGLAGDARRRRPGGSSHLRRAIGDCRSVIDATGGFGTDAWTLACSGLEVTVIERAPIMIELLKDALALAREHSPAAAARLRLFEGDARTWLTELPPAEAIYMDPMFPPKRRASALPTKDMQFLAAIAGDDGDALELLEVARRAALRRVIVKRPPHAAPLAPRVAHAIESKLLRFDVYLPAHGERDGSPVDGGRR
ncbi:MAG: class I SAM-dependent methyltransferase [Phycisphaeraceae bacterium]|nr:class I SAM-dependent methyltransferase [Phycisphaeraceae bacterium]